MRTSLLGSLALAALLTPLSLHADGVAVGEVYNNLGDTLRDAVLELEGGDLRVPLHGGRDFRIALPPGRHVLVASAFGYRKVRRSLQVREGEETSLDFVLNSLVHSPYRGAVRSGADGAGLEASYRVLDTPLDPGSTSATGHFAGYLPPGRYRVVFEAPGFYPEEVGLQVPNQELIVRLKPEPGRPAARRRNFVRLATRR